jgi:hypothetical protein
MLESRNIITTLLGETMTGSMAKGCLQGGVLLPMLWSLVVGELLWEPNDNDYYITREACDIVILINGKFPQAVSQVLQAATDTVQKWCDMTYLSINTNKIVIITFTRKRDIWGLKEPNPLQ